MVSRLHVRVLLDTGPTDEEVCEIQEIFGGLGMEATAEGHSYGGPPPTSAFLIVVNVALSPFLDHVAVRNESGTAFVRVVGRLLAMRADARRWGRAHGVLLEDSHTGLGVSLPGALPTRAYETLTDVDFSSFDHGSPPLCLKWNDPLARWTARLATSPRPAARRVPSRRGAAVEPRVRQLADTEISDMWRLVDHGAASTVTWQRATAVLWSALGWNIVSIAHRTMLSEVRVRSVIRNFNRHGFASLALSYAEGEAVKPTTVEQCDAMAIAARPPSDFGLTAAAWGAGTLAEFLVGEGIVEDVDPGWLDSLLHGPTAVAEGVCRN